MRAFICRVTNGWALVFYWCAGYLWILRLFLSAAVSTLACYTIFAIWFYAHIWRQADFAPNVNFNACGCLTLFSDSAENLMRCDWWSAGAVTRCYARLIILYIFNCRGACHSAQAKVKMHSKKIPLWFFFSPCCKTCPTYHFMHKQADTQLEILALKFREFCKKTLVRPKEPLGKGEFARQPWFAGWYPFYCKGWANPTQTTLFRRRHLRFCRCLFEWTPSSSKREHFWEMCSSCLKAEFFQCEALNMTVCLPNVHCGSKWVLLEKSHAQELSTNLLFILMTANLYNLYCHEKQKQ